MNPHAPEHQLFSLPFPRAAELWLAQHKLEIKCTTAKNYQAAVNLLKASLGEVIVRDIHIGHLRTYQAERSKKAGPYLLNAELGVP